MSNNVHAFAHAARSVPGAGRQQWLAWLALVLAVALVVLLYLSLSLAVSADPLLMPLDDTYIHFQYARQLAGGQPLVYHDGDPATTGGTSLIYPPLLAVGELLGFSGWALAHWALGVNVLCFFGAVWLVYVLGCSALPVMRDEVSSEGHALLLALAFAVSGPFVWAALSGMETALFVFAVLLTLYAIQRDRLSLAVGAAVMMSLTRPEGLALAAIAVGALALRIPWPADRLARAKRVVLLALPVLAALVQPAINVLATGSMTSSGMQAKSHLYNTSVPLETRIRDSLAFFVRMWRELLTGHSADWGMFIPWPVMVMAFAALLAGAFMAWRQRRVTLSPVMLAWMLALTAGVATLDTAFWQFKRYQLPVMALFFPAAAWGSALLGMWLVRVVGRRWVQWVLPLLVLLGSLLTSVSFAEKYAVNVQVVRDQQVPMARWVRDNLPGDRRVGVHDVGVMGYFSDHPLYDVVGLTLPGPAESWRQGPGAIYEHMAHSEFRPAYFAIYPDVQGLRYLVDANVMGEVLAEFPVALPADNVAAALDYQAVYTADWRTTRDVEHVTQTTTLDALDQIAGATLVDWIDVANLASEAAHEYTWWQTERPPGFVTEVYRHGYHACGLSDVETDGQNLDCWATDGGRVLTGGEAFSITTRPGDDLLLVTRVHGRASVPLTIYVNGKPTATRVQPAVPGRWIEIATLVDGSLITGQTTRIRISSDGVYMPYAHWAYQGDFEPRLPDDAVAAVAAFGTEGQVRLLDFAIGRASGEIRLELTWQGPAPQTGDGVVFVHLYNRGEINVEPVVQTVTRPAGGVLPPENWLPGQFFDNYSITLPDDLPPGTYQIALGIFDNRTGQRYPVAAETLHVDDGRLFIGEITVEEFSGEN